MLSVGSATPATTFATSNYSYEKRVGEHSFSQTQLSKNPANATSFTTGSPGQGSRHLAKPLPI